MAGKHAKEVSEIQKFLRALPALKDSKFLARYIGSVGHEARAANEQSRLKFLGLSMPQVRDAAKNKFSFSQLPPAEQIPRWLALYETSEIHDELTLALVWLAKYRKVLLQNPELVFALQSRVDNWALSDGVSDLIAEAIESNPKKYFAKMKSWNRSKNPWERRQSLVGLYYYVRERKNPLPVKSTLPLVKNLIDDPHFFVQKGVGWCLREIYQIDAKAQKDFVQKHAPRFSSQAFATATEKYSAAEKALAKKWRAKPKK